MALTGQKYIPSPADIEAAYDMACLGASEKAICEHLQIDRKTFVKNLPSFSRVMKRGKKVFDKHLDRVVPEVVNSLLRKCVGYEYEEVSTKQKGKVKDGQLVNGDIERTVTKKFVPPSDVAMIFFLCNRDKLKWQNTHHVDHSSGGKSLAPPLPAISVTSENARELLTRALRGERRQSDGDRTGNNEDDKRDGAES